MFHADLGECAGNGQEADQSEDRSKFEHKVIIIHTRSINKNHLSD